jgi:transcriptional regulator with XRE-family HTH domain
MPVQRNLIGRQISRIRDEQKISQAGLATKCQLLGWDVSREILARIETQVRCITDSEIVILTRALNVPVQMLFPKRLRTPPSLSRCSRG